MSCAPVTALGPFLPEPDAEAAATVARIVAGTTAFDFTLARVATFPNGIIHLVPEPDDSFRELTRRLAEAFPQCPPYAGQFADVRPHLTLDARSDAVTEVHPGAARRPGAGCTGPSGSTWRGTPPRLPGAAVLGAGRGTALASQHAVLGTPRSTRGG